MPLDDALGDALSASQGTTLHEFITSLVSDTASRAAFLQDPAGALQMAGLSGITPQDLQEALPLVLDYANAGISSAPVAGDVVAQLHSVVESVGVQTGTGTLSADVEDVVSVPAVDSLSGLDGIVDVAAGGAAAAGLQGTVDSVAGGLDVTGEGGLEGVTGSIGGVSDVATGELAGGLTAQGGNLAAGVDSLAGHVGLEGGAGLASSGGALGVDTVAGSVEGTLDATVDGAEAQLDLNPIVGEGVLFAEAGADGAAGGVVLGNEDLGVDASGLVGLGHGVGGVAVNTPTGALGLDAAAGVRSSDLVEVEATDDLGEMLDGDIVGRGTETAASSLAAGAGMATASLDQLSAGSLPGVSDLGNVTGGLPAGLPADVPTDVADVHGVVGQVQGTVQGTAHGVAGGNLPAVGDVTGGLPADVSDVGGIGGVGDVVGQVQGTVQGVAGQVTSNLPADLPTDLPVDLPVANPLPADAPSGVPTDLGGTQDVVGQVQDTVSSTPVGGAVQDVTGTLGLDGGASGSASGSASGGLDLGL